MAHITPDELKTFCTYIYSIAGIYLNESKGYLVESRLHPLLVAFDLGSFSELYAKAKADPSGELEKHIIDAISTNETFFFRDRTPFDQLRYKIIPELIDTKKTESQTRKIPISIWSAACSTGQEVYSIAISLLEVLPNIEQYEISIFGSDISQQAISKASYGLYNKLEVGRGLPPAYLHKYFNQTPKGWRIQDRIRSMASFKVMNLMQPFGSIGPFDIVCCRNVAIYFSPPDKTKLFAKLASVMNPDGYLIIGGSESLSGIAPQFVSRHYLRGMYYQLRPSGKSQRPTAAKERVPEETAGLRGRESVQREAKPPARKKTSRPALVESQPKGQKPPRQARQPEPVAQQEAAPPKQPARNRSQPEAGETGTRKPQGGSGLLTSLAQRKRKEKAVEQEPVRPNKASSSDSLLARLQKKK